MRRRTEAGEVERFYEPPVASWRFGAFPPDQLLISMAFEVGGTYEDWGWIVYERHYVPGTVPAQYRLTTFVTARTLPELLEKAEKKMLGVSAAWSVGKFLEGCAGG